MSCDSVNVDIGARAYKLFEISFDIFTMREQEGNILLMGKGLIYRSKTYSDWIMVNLYSTPQGN